MLTDRDLALWLMGCPEAFFPGCVQWIGQHDDQPFWAWLELLRGCTLPDLAYASRQLATQGQSIPFTEHPGQMLKLIRDRHYYQQLPPVVSFAQWQGLA